MRAIRAIAACITAVVLTACGQGAAPQAQPEPATATAGQAKPEVSFAPAANALTPASLVGRWGDNGDCTKDIVFAADGAFRSYTGGDGTWRLDGDIITMSGQGGTFQVRVEVINNAQLIVHNPDGSVGTSQRC